MNTKTIVITRPVGQARHLIELLGAALSKHVTPQSPQILSLPLLTIIPKTDDQLSNQVFSAMQDADLAIFVSPNAIECTLRLIECAWQDLAQQIVPIGVMGGSSALALRHHGIGSEETPTPILIPEQNAQWDSEGLWQELQSLAWDWSSKKVVIFKGEGGRDWLAETLEAAGATVEAISVYSRIPLAIDNPAWLPIHEMKFDESLWIFTSSEAVRYLGNVIEDQFRQSLSDANALCPHDNIADAARAAGFSKVMMSEPGDEALIRASIAWLAS
ncbi:uroporphyrinogen-III synthase [Polynucleobacter paludilacus]|uniref:uroporphyrinogen-III synthase n=1 Tax=Polynucleobacter paludilacus TaxID=1855895 RepID=UPI001BFD7F3D|nr:uroporphyrinogen-III synthase [Polynucleobacter paludilacus]QWD87466.1 uroporphyrinogen-III synthase [Polynucleobacter paludilacus]